MRWLITLMSVMAINFAVAEESPKIAVVDMERAIFLSDAAKTGVAEFETANKSDIDKIKGLQAELIAAREKLTKEADFMSEDERRTISNEMEQKTQEYQFYGQKLQQKEAQWKRAFANQQLPEMEIVLKSIIDEKGFDLVLNAQSAVFVSPKMDITKLLIERLNSKK